MVESKYSLRKLYKPKLQYAPTKVSSSPQKAKPTIAGQPRPGGDGDGDGLSDNASEVRAFLRGPCLRLVRTVEMAGICPHDLFTCLSWLYG